MIPELKYRPDVDGLRAVAVIAVVAFHAFPDWISGGFVGVVVFFVISGFLISGIIIGKLESDFRFARKV
jgi:peptidoglycan/LPS O-acetylase OafA/YrhL